MKNSSLFFNLVSSNKFSLNFFKPQIKFMTFQFSNFLFKNRYKLLSFMFLCLFSITVYIFLLQSKLNVLEVKNVMLEQNILSNYVVLNTQKINNRWPLLDGGAPLFFFCTKVLNFILDVSYLHGQYLEATDVSNTSLGGFPNQIWSCDYIWWQKINMLLRPYRISGSKEILLYLTVQVIIHNSPGSHPVESLTIINFRDSYGLGINYNADSPTEIIDLLKLFDYSINTSKKIKELMDSDPGLKVVITEVMEGL